MDIRICAAVSIDSIFVQYVHGDGVFYSLHPGLAALTELGLELDSNDKVERKNVKYAKFLDDGKLLVLAKHKAVELYNAATGALLYTRRFMGMCSSPPYEQY